MNVLTRTLRHLTVEECAEVYFFQQEIQLEELEGNARYVSDQPEIIQEWYSEWLRDDHYPLSPVNKDHAEDLWLKFCEEDGR